MTVKNEKFDFGLTILYPRSAQCRTWCLCLETLTLESSGKGVKRKESANNYVSKCFFEKPTR